MSYKPSPRRTGVCRFYTAGEQCRFGDRCRFSHGEQTAALRPQNKGNSREERSAEANALHAWKLSLKQRNNNLTSSIRLNNFFQEASNLIDAEISIKQELIRELASDSGLRRIKAVIEQEYAYGEQALPASKILAEQLLPLFKVITHPDVLVSSILEDEVTVIFRYLHGVTGERFEKLLKWVAEALKAWQDDSTADGAKLDLSLKLSLKVIGRVLEGLTQAPTTTSCHAPINEIGEILVARVVGAESCSAEAHEASISLTRVQQRLNIARSLPDISTKTKKPTTAKAKFKIERQPPGGRHDNDHAAIADIAILPTSEEINSVHIEYLPVQDLSENHLQGLQGLLDRSFRLLREDTVGQLRDAVRAESQRLATQGAKKTQAGARIYSYHNVQLHDLSYDNRKAVTLNVSFDQPVKIDGAKQRKEWWLKMKRLEPEALVCLLDSKGGILFCTVDPKSKPLSRGTLHGKKDEEAEIHFKQLYHDNRRASVSLHLAAVSDEALKPIVGWALWRRDMPQTVLVEFPGVLLPAFKHTLEALQKIRSESDIALSEYLIPRAVDGDHDVALQAPVYATRRGFRFNLRCLTKDNTDLFLAPSEAFDIQQLQDKSTLDNAQAVALQHALTHNLALIQGPPGTGKSYVGVALMRVLLSNKLTKTRTTGANIGPILVITYTNHALDQTLEHLYKAGIKQIVRIGGRSKSEILQDCNLRALSGKVARTSTEKRVLAGLHERKDVLQKELEKSLSKLTLPGFLSFVRWLCRNFPDWGRMIFGTDGKDEDGYIQAQPQDKGKALQQWLRAGSGQRRASRPINDLLRAADGTMSQDERKNLYHFFRDQYTEDVNSHLSALLQDHDRVEARFRAVSEDNDLRILQNADVIGVTTSGLARQLHLLRKVHAQVLVCEEAGEVLEAHILTTFLPSITHAVLIGDHQQLRPQIQNFSLSSENVRGVQFSLDISLFERLIHPSAGLMRLPYHTLDVQRRMHPSISRLVRETLYPTLQDSRSVYQYDDVVGMRKRLYWLDHQQHEAVKSQEDQQTSQWNQFEVDMATALVRHLICQGAYEPDEIAVLTPYLGQLQHLRQELGKTHAIVLGERDVQQLEDAGINAPDQSEDDTVGQTAPPEVPTVDNRAVSKTTLLKALRIATVDNFQGEEAKVIILSLVRSNAEKKCGFLKTPNRINVALSRAQHGMYIIGDASTAGHKVEMWAKVIALLSADGNLGPNFELQCPRHPNTPITVSQPHEFLRFSPEGGCDLKCADRLECGHKCIAKCHSKVLHKAVRCLEECPRSIKGCDHTCPNPCGDPCPSQCQVNMHDPIRTLPCGHLAPDIPCWQTQANLAFVKCRVKVQRTIPGCDHKVTECCHIDVNDVMYKCPAICNVVLPCNHTCREKCRTCTKRGNTDANADAAQLTFETNHDECKTQCGRKHTNCAHYCTQPCHPDSRKCPPCSAPCDTMCSHSKCSRACSEPCRPCAESSCASECPHSKCTLPCAVPCNNLPCSLRCTKKLACGHQCPSLCSELCPDANFCQMCASDDVLNRQADLIMFTEYRDLDLNETPCIFPHCGHFYTVDTLDGQMSMGDYFDINMLGKVMGFKADAARPFAIDEIKKCADCRGSLRSINRYGRLVRRAMIDESTKRFIVWSNAEYAPLALDLEDIKNILSKLTPNATVKIAARTVKLKGSSDQVFQTVKKAFGQYYSAITMLRHRIMRYYGRVRIQEQPFQTIVDLVENARRRQGIESNLNTEDSLVQTRACLLAKSLLIRCDLLVLTDIMRIRSEATSHGQEAQVDFSKARDACLLLMEEATASKNVLQIAEGNMFFAQYAALERQGGCNATKAAEMLESATRAVDAVKDLVAKHPNQTRPVAVEIDGVERMLNGGVFYEPIANEEMRSVVQAMASEFSGTGHWYYCQNGHPFTIGECGMPMEETRCPQCEAPIGGRGHTAVAGVTRADDIELSLRDIQL